MTLNLSHDSRILRFAYFPETVPTRLNQIGLCPLFWRSVLRLLVGAFFASLAGCIGLVIPYELSRAFWTAHHPVLAVSVPLLVWGVFFFTSDIRNVKTNLKRWYRSHPRLVERLEDFDVMVMTPVLGLTLIGLIVVMMFCVGFLIWILYLWIWIEHSWPAVLLAVLLLGLIELKREHSWVYRGLNRVWTKIVNRVNDWDPDTSPTFHWFGAFWSMFIDRFCPIVEITD